MPAVDLNPAFSYELTAALYIEGLKCHFTTAQLMTEDGATPVLYFTVPATPEMRRIATRARVHFIVTEPAFPYAPIIMGEYEIADRGFDKSVESRELVFTALHVTSHLDQYPLTTLNVGSSAKAIGGVADLTDSLLTSISGSVLEFFQPDNLRSVLKAFNSVTANDAAFAAVKTLDNTPDRKTDVQNLTVADVVRGAFLLYRSVFQHSRVKDTYTNAAMDLHQLMARFQFPNPDLINWSQLYEQVIDRVLAYGTQEVGGRITFMDLIRTICQYFLYQVTIVPNAESVTKQIQIKPATHFNAVPKCNVFFPCMIGDINYKESFTTQPTRLQATFTPSSLPPSITNVVELERHFTQFAPSELQYLWELILKANPTSGMTALTSVTNLLTDLKAPGDGIPFLTREENERGILPMDYTVPPNLNTIITSQIMKLPDGSTESAQSSLPAADDPAQAAAVHNLIISSVASDRVVKYRAFLCLALGDAGGIVPSHLPSHTAPYKKYPLTRASNATWVTDTSTFPAAVPNRITLMPFGVDLPDFLIGFEKEIQESGANYFITGTGEIIELRQRKHHTFLQPQAIPYGLTISGVSGTADVSRLNSETPPTGVAYSAWKSNQFKVKCTGLTMNGPGLVIAANPYTYVVSASTANCLSFAYADMSDPTTVPATPINTTVTAGRIDRTPMTTDNLLPGKTVVELVAKDSTGAVLNVPGRYILQGYTADANHLLLQLNANLPVLSNGEPVSYDVTISNATTNAQFKPWVFCNNGPAVSALDIATHLGRVLTVARPSISGLNVNQVAPGSGNERNVVIAFASTNGTLTADQQSAAAFLVAVIQEMQVTNPGTTKAPVMNIAARVASPGIDLPVVEASSYYGGTPLDVLTTSLQASAVSVIKTQATNIRNQLFADFQAWDATVENTTTPPTVSIVTPGTNADDSALPVNVSFSSEAPTLLTANTPGTVLPSTDITTNTPTAASSGDPNNIETLMLSIDELSKGYIRGYLNFQFFNSRIATQNMTLPMPFNPYMTVGYPALALDNTSGGYDIVGYLHATVHSFTPTSGSSAATMTHLRRSLAENPLELEVLNLQDAKDATTAQLAQQANPDTVQPTTTISAAQRESMLPFSTTLTNQFVFVTPVNDSRVNQQPLLDPATKKPYSNLKVANDMTLYSLYLNNLKDSKGTNPALLPSTFLPIQLHDLDTKLPPLFMYDGGFGLNGVDWKTTAAALTGLTDNMRNFTSYAVYLGYNEPKDNQLAIGGTFIGSTAGSSVESNFIFADTFPEDVRLQSVIDAYNYIRRGVQRVAQNNLAYAQASLVDYATFQDDLTNYEQTQEDAGLTNFSITTGVTVDKTEPDASILSGLQGIPDEIVVYQTPPTYVDGVKTAAGKVVTFDFPVRDLVAAHNTHVDNSEALSNVDSSDT